VSLDKILAYAQSQGSSLILSSLLPDGFSCAPAEDRMTRMERVLAFANGQDMNMLGLAEVAVKQFTREVRGKEEVVRPHQEMRAGEAAAAGAGRAAWQAGGKAAWDAGRQEWPHPDAVGGHKVLGVYGHPKTGNALYDLGHGLHAEGVPGKGGQFKPGGVMKSNTGLQKEALAAKGWQFARPPKPGAGKAAAGRAPGADLAQQMQDHSAALGRKAANLGSDVQAKRGFTAAAKAVGEGADRAAGGDTKGALGSVLEARQALGYRSGAAPHDELQKLQGHEDALRALQSGARPAAAGKPAAGKSAVEKVTGIRPGQVPKAGVKARKIQAGLAAQQQEYMQRHGFKIDPNDWHQDWVPPHEDRINPEFGPPSGDIKDLSKPGREGAEGTAADPIDVKGDSKEALRQLAQGKHVRLNKPSELTLLMQQIARHAAETEASGKPAEAPDWDFGRLSVKGTNLFAAQSKGIRRINMPQFSGLATPGSHAAQVAGGAGKFADLTDEFEKHLQDKGIKVTRETMPASHLKATQSELVGAKVAGFANAFLHGNPKAVKAMSEPIMVTKDGYVIDGHHRWGANMLVDAVDGKLGDDAPMNVRKVDMEIGAMIPYANHWAAMNGIQSAAASAADTGAALKK
jgi:hypothetical protein